MRQRHIYVLIDIPESDLISIIYKENLSFSYLIHYFHFHNTKNPLLKNKRSIVYKIENRFTSG